MATLIPVNPTTEYMLLIVITVLGVVSVILFFLFMFTKRNFGTLPLEHKIRGFILAGNRTYKIKDVRTEKASLVADDYKNIYDSRENTIYDGVAGPLAFVVEEANSAVNAMYARYMQKLAKGENPEKKKYTGIDDAKLDLYENYFLKHTTRDAAWKTIEENKIKQAKGYREILTDVVNTTTSSESGQMTQQQEKTQRQAEPMSSRDYNAFMRDIDLWILSEKDDLLKDEELKMGGAPLTFNGLTSWLKSSPTIVTKAYWVQRGRELQSADDTKGAFKIMVFAIAFVIVIVGAGIAYTLFK